tara:strand:- start:487 stop:1164 length:678 start_codon:yes stop_codon:yes gene_type:complete
MAATLGVDTIQHTNGTTAVTVGTNGSVTAAGALTAAGAVSGTTGTFSGAVSGTAGTFSGAVSGTAGEFRGAVVQRQYVSLSSATQLTRGGALAELSSNLRIAFTPKHANSVLYAEVSAFYGCPNSANLLFSHIYDVTNSVVPSLPPANGSRQRVHWAKRTGPHDANDLDMMSYTIPIAAANTNTRVYTIWVGTEGVTLQFLVSNLSSAGGAVSPITFIITEIYNP